MGSGHRIVQTHGRTTRRHHLAARGPLHFPGGRRHPLHPERHRLCPDHRRPVPRRTRHPRRQGGGWGLYFSPYPAAAAYVNFRDFEITNSDTNRVSGKPVAIYTQTSDHLKFINLVIHDTGEGFFLSAAATNTEVYGSLVYYNGALDGLEHGIYIQNVSGYKKAIDNVVFNNAGMGIHAYAHSSQAALLDVSLIGNIAFNNGLLGPSKPHPDLLVGGQAVVITPEIDGNVTYKAAPGNLWNQMIGASPGCASPTVTNNYFVGTTLFTNCTSLTMAGNIFYGQTLTRANYGSTHDISQLYALR